MKFVTDSRYSYLLPNFAGDVDSLGNEQQIYFSAWRVESYSKIVVKNWWYLTKVWICALRTYPIIRAEEKRKEPLYNKKYSVDYTTPNKMYFD